MAKRAPGPWMCYGLPGKQDWGVGNRSIEICDGLSEANARFIATAPDLLEVAEKLEILMEKHGQLHAADKCGLCAEYMDALHSTIAKAEGVDHD